MTFSLPVGSSQFDRILVVRLSAMGDIIHTLPAVAALRQAFPQASLGWLIEERWVELLCAPSTPRSGPRSPERPLIDGVHTINLAEWRRALFSFKTVQQIAARLRELRGIHYDAVIDFQGAIRSAVLARCSGAPVVYGDANPREMPARIFYTRKIFMPPSATHVVQQAIALASGAAGCEAGPVPLRQAQAEFPVDPDAENKIASLLADARITNFAILNPGAGWGAKMWPVARYGQVAKALADDGFTPLINCGPGEDVLGSAVVDASGGAARKVSCSISELISLTRRAQLFIGGDTGPMHLAAALNIPVVAIFGPTNPARNGPFGTRSIVLRSPSSITDHSRHGKPEPGLLEITADAVVAASRKLLDELLPDPSAEIYRPEAEQPSE